MATRRAPKPEPIVVTTICSLCDQAWEDHGDEPTTADCIRLLKQQLALKPAPVIRWSDYGWNTLPTYQPTWIYPATTTISSPDSFTSKYDINLSQLSAGAFTDNVFEFRKPDDGDDGSAPVPAVT